MSIISNVARYGPLFGAAYFSAVITTTFYGVTCMQTFFYFVHYQRDALHMKILVASLWTLNTLHEALTVAGAYKYTIAGLVNPSAFTNTVPELILQVLPTVLIAILTQGFLVHRIYITSGKRIIALLAWFVLAILQLVPSIIYVAKSLYTSNGSLHAVGIAALSDQTLSTVITLSASVGAVEDILIAISLVFLYIQKRSVANFASSAHIFQRLTVFVVNTGTWLALFALLSVILLHVSPSKMLYAVFIDPLCPIYCNTLLANLNARVYIREGATTESINLDLFSSSTPSVSNKRRGEAARLTFATSEGVRKTTEVVTFSDIDPFSSHRKASELDKP